MLMASCALCTRAEALPADRWVELAPPARAEHVAVLDDVRQRLVLFGGLVEGTLRNDVWMLSLAPHGRWELVEPAGPRPSPRAGAMACFDHTRQRLLVYGGADTLGHALDEVWELSLRGRPAWRRCATVGPGPEARVRGTLTLEPGGASAILFGGCTNRIDIAWRFNDAWRLDLGTFEWTYLATTGPGPEPRDRHSAVYCPELGGILVMGGLRRYTDPDCPSCREAASCSDLWLLTRGGHPAWRLLHPDTTRSPGGIQDHFAAWDEPAHRMLVCGGTRQVYLSANAPARDSVWAYDVRDSSWARLRPLGEWPAGRCFAAAAWDAANRKLVLHGGARSTYEIETFSDAHLLSVGDRPAWTTLSAGTPYTWRRSTYLNRAPAVFDSVADRVLVDDGESVWANDPRTGLWSALSTTGSLPPPRYMDMVILDARRHRLLFCFGYDMSQPDRWVDMRSLWALDLDGATAHWTRLTDDTGIGPQSGSVTYDPPRDRLLALGIGGLWSLPLDGKHAYVWTPVDTLPSRNRLAPEKLWDQATVHDPGRDRLVTFGGSEYTGDWPGAVNGCWALALPGPGDWQTLSPSSYAYGSRPSARASAAGVYDPQSDRLLVIGGYAGPMGGRLPDDAIALDLGSNTWSDIAPPGSSHPRWLQATAVWDSRRKRTLVFQSDAVWAIESARVHGDTGGIAHDHERTPRATGAPVLALRGARPNPAAGQASIEFTLPDAAPATLELLDIAGRRVWSQDVSALGSGAHRVQVGSGCALAPGLYVVRLNRGTVTQSCKLVRLPR
jgi:hypothetical protein